MTAHELHEAIRSGAIKSGRDGRLRLVQPVEEPPAQEIAVSLQRIGPPLRPRATGAFSRSAIFTSAVLGFLGGAGLSLLLVFLALG